MRLTSCLLVVQFWAFASGLQVGSAKDETTDYIPKETFGVISLNVKAVREFPGGELFPYEFTNGFFKEEFSFRPTDFDHVKWLFATDENMAPDFSIGVILTFAKDVDIKKYIAEIDEVDPEDVVGHQVDDLTIFESDEGFFAVQVDKKTVLVSGAEPFVLLMAASKKVKTKMTAAVSAAGDKYDFSVFLSTSRFNRIVGEAITSSPLPKEIKELPNQISFLQLTGKFKGFGVQMESKITASTTQAARAVESGLKKLLEFAEESLSGYLKLMDDNNLEEKSIFLYLRRMSQLARRDFKFERESKTVSFKYEADNFVNLALGVVILFSYINNM